MKSEKVTGARRNDVAFCSKYCRTCHWYTDALRKPAMVLGARAFACFFKTKKDTDFSRSDTPILMYGIFLGGLLSITIFSPYSQLSLYIAEILSLLLPYVKTRLCDFLP